MGYITAANVRTKVWRVTENEIDDDMMNEAILMAASDIDSALDSVYAVPFDPVPDIVTAINNALLRYYGQFVVGHAYGNISKPDTKAYEWAQEKLKAIKSGKETIPGVDRKGNRVRCSTSDYSTVFNRDDPKHWGPDPDQLDDIANERAE